MLKIERQSDGCVTTLRLSGWIQADQIAGIRSEMNQGCAREVLELGEVTLADMSAVRFLIRSEDEGVELLNCPRDVREWMYRERAEEAERQTV